MTAWFSSMRYDDKWRLAVAVAALASMYLIVANGWLWGTLL
jgi:hypothetical protein